MIIQIQTKAKKREVRLIKSQAPMSENNTIPVIPPIMICDSTYPLSQKYNLNRQGKCKVVCF